MNVFVFSHELVLQVIFVFVFLFELGALGKWVWQSKQTPHCNFPYLRAICTHVTPYNTMDCTSNHQTSKHFKMRLLNLPGTSSAMITRGWIEIRTLSVFFSRVKFAVAWQKVLVFKATAEEKARVNQILCQTAPLRPFKVSLRPFKFVKKSDNCLTGGWVGRVDRVSRFKFVITCRNNFLKITLPTPEMKKELLNSQVEVYFEL